MEAHGGTLPRMSGRRLVLPLLVLGVGVGCTPRHVTGPAAGGTATHASVSIGECGYTSSRRGQLRPPAIDVSRNVVAAPPVTLGAPVSTSVGIDKEVIRRYIRMHLSKIEYCYQKQLLVKPALTGTIVVSFNIDAGGRVTQLVARQSLDKDVDKCVLTVLAAIQFPRPAGGGIVNVTSYPFTFRPANASDPLEGIDDDAPPDQEIEPPDLAATLLPAHLTAHRGALAACVERHPFTSLVEFELDITEDGRVTEARPQSYESEPAVKCVTATLEALHIPSAEEISLSCTVGLWSRVAVPPEDRDTVSLEAEGELPDIYSRDDIAPVLEIEDDVRMARVWDLFELLDDDSLFTGAILAVQDDKDWHTLTPVGEGSRHPVSVLVLPKEIRVGFENSEAPFKTVKNLDELTAALRALRAEPDLTFPMGIEIALDENLSYHDLVGAVRAAQLAGYLDIYPTRPINLSVTLDPDGT
jgi:hypothetical protein